MNKTQNQHRKEAMQDPGDTYLSPEDVLKDTALSREQRMEVLVNWSDEIRHILESKSENMCPEEGTACEEELLQQLMQAIDVLNNRM
ncbi:MAG: hypothetical protein IT559_02070 [Alphaproteobacteria bacterium]|nr:hypothetical protein [Alphaproteobacteria bacterium]